MAKFVQFAYSIVCTWIFLHIIPVIVAQTNCDEWVLSEGSQYCFQAIQGTNSKSQCVDLCTTRGAKLPLVTSAPVNRKLTELIEERHLVEVWLGLEEVSATWHWLDDRSEVAGQGCYIDDEEDRDLQGPFEIEGGVTVESCRRECYNNGFQYCGLQGGDTCWCGDTYGRHGMTDGCNVPCAANFSETCGGVTANKIYSTRGVYSDWGSDQPNNHLFYQACGVADYSLQYRWNDATCIERNSALCEKSMAEDDCSDLYVDGKCVTAFAERKNWFDWNYDCQQTYGGRLLHIRSATEANAVKLYIQEYLTNNSDVELGNKTSFWLNLVEKRWEWFTGEPILYNNWATGKPNGWNLPCATIKESGFWDDIECNLFKGCLCQIDNASHIVEIPTQPPLPPVPTTTISTSLPPTTITIPSAPFFSLQGYGQWIILAGGILFFLILMSIIICQLRLWKKRKEKKAKDFNLYYGMDDPDTPGDVTSSGNSAEPVFIDPTTLNPHAPDGKLNMLGSWEIPALTEHEEEARIKAKQNSSRASTEEQPDGETGVSYSTEPVKTEEQQSQEGILLF